MELWCSSVILLILQNGFFTLAISPDILRSATDTADFLNKFVRMPDGSPMTIDSLHQVTNNTDAMHISGVGTARLASYDRCEPRFVTVMIDKDPNSNVLLWPPCTRIERCSGCCPSEVLTCEPIQTEMVTLTVIRNVMPYQGSPEFQFGGLTEVQVERHLKCDQRCRVKAYHCNPNIHDYLERDCRCRCKQRQTCASSQHIWREEKCKCECAQTTQCVGFARFDESTCQCDVRQLVAGGITEQERQQLSEILNAPAPTTPAPACPGMNCRPGWSPRLYSNGRCGCFPTGFSGLRRRR